MTSFTYTNFNAWGNQNENDCCLNMNKQSIINLNVSIPKFEVNVCEYFIEKLKWYSYK